MRVKGYWGLLIGLAVGALLAHLYHSNGKSS